MSTQGFDGTAITRSGHLSPRARVALADRHLAALSELGHVDGPSEGMREGDGQETGAAGIPVEVEVAALAEPARLAVLVCPETGAHVRLMCSEST